MEPYDLPDDLAGTLALFAELRINVTVEDITNHLFHGEWVNICLDHPEGDYKFELVPVTMVQQTIMELVRDFDVHDFYRWRRRMVAAGGYG